MRLLFSLMILLLGIPFFANALIFGGRIGDGPRCDGRVKVNCYNSVIWAGLGPPRGGKFIWAPGVTKTYSFGPPKGSGQWLIGLHSPSYFCVARLLPLIVCPGTIMTMLGSSGGSVNSAMQFSNNSSPAFGGNVTADKSSARIVINEVGVHLDGLLDSHWLELYNAGETPQSIYEWKLRRSGAVSLLADDITIQPKGFAILASPGVIESLKVPAGTPSSVVYVDSKEGGLILENKAGTRIDAIAWNEKAKVSPVFKLKKTDGTYLARKKNGVDTNTADDWEERAIGTPGK